MQFNHFYWDLYKSSDVGKAAISKFEHFDIEAILQSYTDLNTKEIEALIDWADILLNASVKPQIREIHSVEDAELFFNELTTGGILLEDDNGKENQFFTSFKDAISNIEAISIYLFCIAPVIFIPYFWPGKFKELTMLLDAFEIDFPEIPAKTDHRGRFMFYWELCRNIYAFRTTYKLSYAEIGAFLYDFTPKSLHTVEPIVEKLPAATQTWFVGADKGDFAVIDQYNGTFEHIWQCNADTRKGDLVVVYCLSPRSRIESVWRAATNGIADPLYHHYSYVYVRDCNKIEPITLNQLKTDAHFKTHLLIRKNLQGISGYPLTAGEYNDLLNISKQNGGAIDHLPQIYNPYFVKNEGLHIERDVEIALIEPFLELMGYGQTDWVRQLVVKMGRGERNFPDYAILNKKEKGFEEATFLIEVKFWIRGSKDLNEAFRQVWSYGLRLNAITIVVADKTGIWLYQKENGAFNRNRFIRKYWKELEQPDEMAQIRKILGKRE